MSKDRYFNKHTVAMKICFITFFSEAGKYSVSFKEAAELEKHLKYIRLNQ